MVEFFKGWRRKVGAFTLVMTCVFMAGWVRSFGQADAVNSQTTQFISHHGGIFCQFVPDRFDFGFSCYSTDAKMMRNAYSHSSCEDIWDWKGLGFAFGSSGEITNEDGTTSKVTLFSFYIPYWSIVIPLALISAFLFLSKPRKSVQQKIAEPLVKT